MIKDHYKTKILHAAIHLKTSDGFAMSSLGKATSHVHSAILNFSHGFVICHKLHDTDILFDRDIQKRYSLSYSWDVDIKFFIQREGSFLTYTRNCEQQHNIAALKSSLKIPPRYNDIIPVTIKRQNLKTPVGDWWIPQMLITISDQHINRRLDQNIHEIDGIYNIKDR